MNAQTANIDIVDNKADVDEVIRCEQLTRRCPHGNILTVDPLNFMVYSYK